MADIQARSIFDKNMSPAESVLLQKPNLQNNANTSAFSGREVPAALSSDNEPLTDNSRA
jgi:hypothetical protein